MIRNCLLVAVVIYAAVATGCRAPLEPPTPSAPPDPPAPSVSAIPPVSRVEAPPPPVFVWWEGEEFKETNVKEPLQNVPGNKNAEQQSKLSGGAWLTPSGPESDTPYFVKYEVSAPASTTYDLWVRKFWLHGPFKWRFDDAEWRACTRNIALHDSTNLELYWGANWVFLGKVDLNEGAHAFEIEMTEKKGGGCIDCFLLIDQPFVPRGALKPGETSGQAETGYFAWEPPGDPLSDDCPIDLRFLNEAEAGQGGAVKRVKDGFLLGDGTPVRFWMVQGSSILPMKKPMVDFWARRLAKYGVNLVRLQLSDLCKAWDEGNKESFGERLSQMQYVVAALKKQGIYSYFGHFYWDSGNPRLFVDTAQQGRYLERARAVMTAVNPHTGLSFAEDPAVMVFEIQNESNLLFWSINPDSMPDRIRELLEKGFGEWAAAKHGSIEKALAAWGPEKHPKTLYKKSADTPGEGRLGLYGIAHLTGNDWSLSQHNRARASDQLRYYVKLQKGFYEKMIGDLREKTGVKNLIACSNWKTADPRVLEMCETYSYTPGDVICRNVYFGTDFKPDPERFYQIDLGNTYKDGSMLKPPRLPAPFTIVHTADHPYMITENNWCRPNRFRAEWPFLVASYGAMMGIDGWVFFATDTAVWSSGLAVWDVNSPSVLGQFPAAALTYRSGYVKEAPVATTEKLGFDDIYGFKGASLYELGGNDALWQSKIGGKEGDDPDAKTDADRFAFFVGRVKQTFGEGASTIETVDLSKYVDRKAQTVRSMTDEIEWNWGRGILTLDTPFAQGACGFLGGAEPLELKDITVRSENEYVSIMVVSLDRKPLNESRRILIQACTEDTMYGFKTEPMGEYKRIVSLGGYPQNVKKIQATVTIKGITGTAVVLDGNGYFTEREAETAAGVDGLEITLPEDALYTILRRGKAPQ